MDLSDLRQSYSKGSFGEEDLLESPFAQFEKWFREAEKCELEEPNAMCLATADASGQPTTRIVLLKDFSEKGLTFYTNYESRKSEQIDERTQRRLPTSSGCPCSGRSMSWARSSVISKAESLKYFFKPTLRQSTRGLGFAAE